MGIANVVHNVIYHLFQAIMNDINDINDIMNDKKATIKKKEKLA